MKFLAVLSLLFSTAIVALALPSTPDKRAAASSWPHGPFSTRGGDIVNANGQKVIFAGTNWPMSGESMLPEGLEYQPLSAIVGRLKEAGFNFVRHTYAIQMIDEIYANNGRDVTLRDTMVHALGEANGTRVTNDIIKHNPQWTAQTTRLQILADVAKAEAQAGILMHLDNHISVAQWCCGATDGNGWFGDRDFDVAKWHRGLQYMAKWAKGHANVQTISLRNELRKSKLDDSLEYSWVNWWNHVREAAELVHAANPDLVITLSGLDYDIDLSAVTTQADLRTAPSTDSALMKPKTTSSKPVIADIKSTSFGKANKAVLELHAYKQSDFYSENGHLNDCPLLEAAFYRFGFNAVGMSPPAACRSDKWEEPYGCPRPKINLPVLLTEFGDAIDSNYKSVTLQKCLRDWTTKNKIGWAQWSLAGSYRIREGKQQFEDTWGLTTKDWSAWRSTDAMENFFKPWVRDMGRTNLEL
ncbi:uncharacterized protein PFL1_04296 [Pseudozyma flocculosa PF-1]|uniref:Related to cellulase n=2 Tax=Pseudozyma flocculosa TaxID=84751 RepID=A0A5C3FB21_9BASI|nr:uncharacterized protein PFL1_04296 [Pseudozyma flocculosa PF-1]EPQ27969.1 hypothetical protein PFL1_04296 [Pseudozyma flocculosa PF-1]SPO41643.1 related to cellulase [Pseudozyma flocculosa]